MFVRVFSYLGLVYRPYAQIFVLSILQYLPVSWKGAFTFLFAFAKGLAINLEKFAEGLQINASAQGYRRVMQDQP